MKVCTKCNLNKELNQYGKNKVYTDGHQYWCKTCHKDYKKSYYFNNLDKARQERLNWKKSNKIKIQAYTSAFTSNRYKNDPVFRIIKNQRNRVKQLITNRPTSFTKSVGCSSDFLKSYLESKFLSGMTWVNYGNGNGFWNIDHIRPISSFNDLTDKKQFEEAFNYKNLQPMWWKDNLLKSNKWSEDAY